MYKSSTSLFRKPLKLISHSKNDFLFIKNVFYFVFAFIFIAHSGNSFAQEVRRAQRVIPTARPVTQEEIDQMDLPPTSEVKRAIPVKPTTKDKNKIVPTARPVEPEPEITPTVAPLPKAPVMAPAQDVRENEGEVVVPTTPYAKLKNTVPLNPNQVGKVTSELLSSVPRVTEALADLYFKQENEKFPTINPGFQPVQIAKARVQDLQGVDRCSFVPKQDNFLGAIEGAVRNSLLERKIESNSAIDSAKDGYNLPGKEASEPVSLISNPLCVQDEQALAHVLGKEQAVPKISESITSSDGTVTTRLVTDRKTIDTLRNFSMMMNDLRETALSDSSRKKDAGKANAALGQYVNKFTQMMSCLAYKESLQTTGEMFTEADVAAYTDNKELKSSSYMENEENFAKAIAKYPELRNRYTVNGELVRPEGVQFGTDRPGEYDATLAPKRPRALDIQKKTGLQNSVLKQLERLFYAKFGRTLTDHKKIDDLLVKLSPGEKRELEDYYKFKNELIKKYPPWPVTGLFQFDPKSYGNISMCVRQWNSVVQDSTCKIDPPNSESAIFAALSSPGQTFNAWCGVQKIVQSFNSQVNTFNSTGTDLSNIVNGTLKEPKDRCVSLVARAGTGKIFTHFGPFANSTGKNLADLMSCIEFTKTSH